MKYSHNYTKLLLNEYTTIRRYPKGKVGKIVKESYPKGWHFAKIIKIERSAISRIPISLLQCDTDLLFRDEIYALFQSFYKKPINFDKERFYIYCLKRC